MVEVTLNGRRYTITQESVERVTNLDPTPVQRYTVKVGDRVYPIKQAVSVGLGRPPVEFTSQHAYRWLAKLGYDVVDTQEG